jgi:molybdenum cofactor cytidylyltransferase
MTKVGAIILAAGRSSRMGRNKMLEPIEGKAMLLHVVDAVQGAELNRPIIALGHQAERVLHLLENYEYTPVLIPDFAEGLSYSLKGCLAAVPVDWDAAFICLGDMPYISAPLLTAMAAHATSDKILLPVFAGQRGNPILWGKRFFAEMLECEGDAGARALIAHHAASVEAFAAQDNAIHRDIDCVADLMK